MAAVCHAVHRAAEALGQLQAAFGGDDAVVIADNMVNLRRHRAQRRMVDAGAVGVGVHVEITDDGQGGQASVKSGDEEYSADLCRSRRAQEMQQRNRAEAVGDVKRLRVWRAEVRGQRRLPAVKIGLLRVGQGRDGGGNACRLQLLRQPREPVIFWCGAVAMNDECAFHKIAPSVYVARSVGDDIVAGSSGADVHAFAAIARRLAR